MQSIAWLVNKIRQDYPNIDFAPSDRSFWSPSRRTIFYETDIKHADWVLLHELAHSVLNHGTYDRDISLLAIERDAWQYAKNRLGPNYNIKIDDGFIEDHLDTYRNWLHTKSTCPKCGLNGPEILKGSYQCMACGNSWQVNEARSCNVKRTNTKKR